MNTETIEPILNEEDIIFSPRIFDTNRSKLYQESKMRKGPCVTLRGLQRVNVEDPDVESIHYSKEEKLTFDTKVNQRSPNKKTLNLKLKNSNDVEEIKIENILKAGFGQFS